MDAPGDLPFPHVSQVYLIERHVTGLDGKPLSDVAALGVTSLTASRAGPETIASLVRGQWAIESLHWLRDTLYREDNSTVRTRSGPRALATLRNLAVGALHQAGRDDTTEATRWPAATSTVPSPSSGSRHDLETVVDPPPSSSATRVVADSLLVATGSVRAGGVGGAAHARRSSPAAAQGNRLRWRTYWKCGCMLL
jgi:hypothetical protein